MFTENTDILATENTVNAPLTSEEHMEPNSTKPTARSGKKYKGMVAMLAVGFLSVTGFSLSTGMTHVFEPATAGHGVATVPVKCVPVVSEEIVTQLSLPADIQAMQSSNIYARVNGYLKKRLVDIGSSVKSGQVIAEIDTPELDQQLAEAQAQLVQAQANVENALAIYQKSLTDLESSKSTIEHNRAVANFAKGSYERWQVLQQEGAVSKQDRDSYLTSWQTGTADLASSQSAKSSAEAQVAANHAAILVARANEKAIRERVRELEVTQHFKHVIAPFDGTITNRFVDPGQLISSGGGQGSTQLFDIVDQRRLRIYVQVPERNIAALKEGMPVEITVETFPHEVFFGKITNVSGGLDSGTRTMQVEIQMDNRNKKLHAGMFATAKLSMQNTDVSPVVPAASVVIKDADTCVQVLGKDGRFHWQSVIVAKELGKQTVVTSGVKAGDYVAASPNEEYLHNPNVVAVKETKTK
jgi:RND family efflux transporter MFP subunit